MTKTIAITGGIGSGKSTFSNEVIKRKYKLMDSDKEVSNLYKKPTKDFLNYLIKIGLGDSIKKNNIDKKTIREKVFTNKTIKLKLEKYIFKIIRQNREKFIKKGIKNKTKFLFFDIPLLFENNINENFDLVISIISKKKLRFERLKKSKNYSKNIFNQIVKSQTSDLVRRRDSDIIVLNNNNMKEYVIKINMVLDKITK